MKFAVLGALVGAASAALQVDLDSKESILKAASNVAWDLVSYYHGNESGQIPGILPGPPPAGDYYWWEGGALWGTLIDYWHFTGDSTYNNITTYAMIFQAEAPLNSYMPVNWTASLGNDDQGFWGMSAMLAAEVNYPNPPPTQPQWLALAQAVFNTQAARWEDTDCGGGLRWQIPWANKGYDYKNTIANAIFFNLGARLARYTLNETYSDWAVKTWDWMVALNYIDEYWNVYDGGHIADNCTGIEKPQFSYNAATLLQGAAFMYNYTNGSTQDQWRTRVDGLLNRTLEFFFLNGTIVERPCELADKNNCNWDQRSFKGYMLRWMTTVASVAPFTRESIHKALRTSAEGAVASCAGGANGRQCGFRWNTGGFDSYTGAGEEMSALAALMSLLPFFDDQISAPLTNTTGGTSEGNPSAGQEPDSLKPLPPLTMADTAGASVLTFAIGAGLTVMFIWMGQGK
ncbi:mannan endo-1,6-alpha-mannosidase [Thozetella sp. PMI_491]|nr:mannan endo-1,6-alpha-mannosidase [Thozetella sp. PMI_491]